MKKILAGVVVTSALMFGGTVNIISTTPSQIIGNDLYNTPSGNLDVGFFVQTPNGIVAHLPLVFTATSSVSDGFYPVKDTTGLIETRVIGVRYIFYDDRGKILGTSDDPTVGVKLRTPNEALPKIDVSVASLVL